MAKVTRHDVRNSCTTLLLALVIMLAYSSRTIAQVDSVRHDYIGVSYFSEGGFYPGFTLNGERSLLSNRSFEVMVAARLGSYFHYRNHAGIFIAVQSGQRIKLYRSLYFEHYLGLGYLHSFLNGGDAYYIDATGGIHKKSKVGSPHFMPSISFGLGYNTIFDERMVRVHARPIIFWLIPFNRTSLVQYGLEVGVLINITK